MPSLKDLRNRIASVKATQKITKAMQMVAAAKLRRAQEAAEASRPYSERMGAVLVNLASGMSLLLFYAFAMQCMSTLAIVKRETNSWKWPMYQLVVMTSIAYLAALIAYQTLI